VNRYERGKETGRDDETGVNPPFNKLAAGGERHTHDPIDRFHDRCGRCLQLQEEARRLHPEKYWTRDVERER
jgi:hypothetical protein